MVAVPLVVRGKVYGVIELLNRVGEETYTQQDVELLVFCSQAAAKAVEVRLMLAYAIHSRQTGSDSPGEQAA
jgi:GAF domain-containing protein